MRPSLPTAIPLNVRIATLVFASALVLYVAAPVAANPRVILTAAPRTNIYVADLQESGLSGKSYSSPLTNVLAAKLAEQQTCASVTTRSDFSAMLGWAKDQQLAGTPEEMQIQLEDIAAALGGQGMLVFGSFGKTGDTYRVTVGVVDARNAKVIARQSASRKGTDATLIDLVEEVAENLDLSVCRPKWTGVITVVESSTWGSSSSVAGASYSYGGQDGETERKSGDRKTEEISVVIRNANESASGEVRAIMTRKHEMNMYVSETQTAQVNCASGWNANLTGKKEMRSWRYLKEETVSSEGRLATRGTVGITIDAKGHYRIAFSLPSMSVKNTSTKTLESALNPCAERASTQEGNEGRTNLDARSFVLEGDVDPKNPDELTGTLAENEASPSSQLGQGSRSSIRKWSLQREEVPAQ